MVINSKYFNLSSPTTQISVSLVLLFVFFFVWLVFGRLVFGLENFIGLFNYAGIIYFISFSLIPTFDVF